MWQPSCSPPSRNNPKQTRDPAVSGRSGHPGRSLEMFPDLKPSWAPPVPVTEVLDPSLSGWIDTLARLEQTETEDYPSPAAIEIISIFDDLNH
jgi:hypothetical protein